jgi:hypothetical protein
MMVLFPHLIYKDQIGLSITLMRKMPLPSSHDHLVIHPSYSRQLVGAKYLSAGTAAVTKQFRFYDPVS